MTCILTTVSQQITDAIESYRQCGGFVINDFVCDWDFEGRRKDEELTDPTTGKPDNRLHVRVVVPRKWEIARRVSQTELEHIGAWYIDVRQKLGTASQGADGEIERDRLTNLVELVEQIHWMFLTDPPADYPYDLQWLAEDSETSVQSEVFVAYSLEELRKRMFYGICREVFQVTV